MKNWEEDDTENHCAASEDLADAQQVCEVIGIPLHTINFSSEYWDRVFTCFIDEYRAGRTPNPDILCNKEIKFRAFLDHALSTGADHIATGHYARISKNSSGHQLMTGLDRNKDQSYFLYTLGQYPLSHTLFPVGELQKDNVRRIAAENNLVTHDKKDSTGICFIGERNFRKFLQRYLPAQPGNIISIDNQLMGKHDGLMYYTLGQRQGLGIGGHQQGTGEPWFVVDKDMPNNNLVVAQGHAHPAMFYQGLQANQLSWCSGNPPPIPFSGLARVRYRQQPQPCTIDALSNGMITVEFDEPQRAITPGQSIVFYDGETCLGGGVIDKIIKHD